VNVEGRGRFGLLGILYRLQKHGLDSKPGDILGSCAIYLGDGWDIKTHGFIRYFMWDMKSML